MQNIMNCWRVAKFNGYANNARNAGSFYWNLNNAASNVNRNIGTQLAVVVAKPHNKSFRFGGKYVYPITLGRVTEQRGELIQCH